jgi:hypothetical protein
MGHSRHCRGGQKSIFVRFTPLATIFGVGPIGREVPKADNSTAPAFIRYLPAKTLRLAFSLG